MGNGESSYRRFLDGDKSAFDGIMKEYFDPLIFFVNRYVQNVHTAEDIAIDAFAELLAHPGKYNFKVSLKTYLFMIAKSRALSYLRRQKLIRFVPLEDVCELEDGKSVEDAVIKSEAARALSAAIAELPRDMRIAVHLVYFEDMTYAQAAKVMGKSRKQIDSLLYRAKGRLSIILGKDGECLI